MAIPLMLEVIFICLVYGILNIFRMVFIILYKFTVNNLSVCLCMTKYKNPPIWMLLGIPMFWAAKYESEIRSWKFPAGAAQLPPLRVGGAPPTWRGGGATPYVRSLGPHPRVGKARLMGAAKPPPTPGGQEGNLSLRRISPLVLLMRFLSNFIS